MRFFPWIVITYLLFISANGWSDSGPPVSVDPACFAGDTSADEPIAWEKITLHEGKLPAAALLLLSVWKSQPPIRLDVIDPEIMDVTIDVKTRNLRTRRDILNAFFTEWHRRQYQVKSVGSCHYSIRKILPMISLAKKTLEDVRKNTTEAVLYSKECRYCTGTVAGTRTPCVVSKAVRSRLKKEEMWYQALRLIPNFCHQQPCGIKVLSVGNVLQPIFKPGDILLNYNGSAIDVEAARNFFEDLRAGRPKPLAVHRNSATLNLQCRAQ